MAGKEGWGESSLGLGGGWEALFPISSHPHLVQNLNSFLAPQKVHREVIAGGGRLELLFSGDLSDFPENADNTSTTDFFF